jgi:hypothetical protein
LDLKKYQPHKGQQTGIHHTLKEVVTHKGGSVDKGHYVTYIQSSYGKSWTLFEDQTVKWVKEEEVLCQEAFLLIYFRTTPPILFDGRKTNQPTKSTREPPTTTTQHQPPLLGSDITGTVSPVSREEPTDQPDSLLTSMDDENDQHGNTTVPRLPAEKTGEIINGVDSLINHHTMSIWTEPKTPFHNTLKSRYSKDSNMDRARTGHCILHQDM